LLVWRGNGAAAEGYCRQMQDPYATNRGSDHQSHCPRKVKAIRSRRS